MSKRSVRSAPEFQEGRPVGIVGAAVSESDWDAG
jgi:hypothetical protein